MSDKLAQNQRPDLRGGTCLCSQSYTRCPIHQFIDPDENWAFNAAREIRIKIHNMGEDNLYPSCRASNGENKKFLDRVAAEDARIILKHYHTRDAQTGGR